MATVTTCDLCDQMPRQAGEPEPKATPAKWVVRLRTKNGVEVTSVISLDVCNKHVGEACADLSVRPAIGGPDFLDIVVMKLDVR